MDKLIVNQERTGVSTIILNDPAIHNAIGPDLNRSLNETLDSMVSGSDTRVLVIAAKGPTFCAGVDIPSFLQEESSIEDVRVQAWRYYETFLRVMDLPFPTIAAVQGPAIGAGLNLAFCCDFRFAAPAAKFGAIFTRIGLHPGGGCTSFLVSQLGRRLALKILLEGQSIDAERAAALGLVDEVVDDPLSVAMEFGLRLANLDPHLVRNVKRAVNIAERHGFEPSLHFESWAQASTFLDPSVRRNLLRRRSSR